MDRHLALTSLCVLATTGLFAQPTIPRVSLNTGDVLVIDSDFPITGAGPGGNNVTWDLSSPGFSGTRWTYTAMTAASTPMAADFPGATMALYAEDGTGFLLHAFFDLANGFTEHGEHVSDGVDGYSSVNTDPLTVFTTPLSSTSSGSDTYASTEEFIGTPATLTGRHNWTVDGYGTLLLPNATYTDVLRIHILQTETLSVDLGGSPFDFVTEREEWWWVKAGVPFPLLVFSLETDDFGTEIGATTAMVSFNGATGIGESAEVAMRVYPNPVRDAVTMELEVIGTVRYRVLDALGREALNGSIAAPGMMRHRIDIAALPAGVYHLEVQRAQGVAIARFVKE